MNIDGLEVKTTYRQSCLKVLFDRRHTENRGSRQIAEAAAIGLVERALRRDIVHLLARDPGDVVDAIIEAGDRLGVRGVLVEAVFRRVNFGRS